MVILGHTGFIGGHLFFHFKTRTPQIEMVGRSYPPTDLTDLSEAEKLAELFDRETIVIFLSAVKRQFGDSLESFRKNLEISMNICRVLQKNPVKRLIYFSSAAVYGEDIHNLEITEETGVQPTSYYGMAKYASERLLYKTFEAQETSSLLIVRPPTIYGPNDMGDTYGPMRFVNAAAKDEPITLWGDGTELREFIYIDDVARIIEKLAFSYCDGVLNLACGVSCSFIDVLKTVEDVTGKKPTINYRPRTKKKVDNGFVNTKLVKQIGKTEFTPLREGIRSVYSAIS